MVIQPRDDYLSLCTSWGFLKCVYCVCVCVYGPGIELLPAYSPDKNVSLLSKM